MIPQGWRRRTSKLTTIQVSIVQTDDLTLRNGVNPGQHGSLVTGSVGNSHPIRVSVKIANFPTPFIRIENGPFRKCDDQASGIC